MLCGTPNKGIVISDTMLVGSEFNGAAPFLKGLNSGPDDLIPGVELMAIRSDKNDKYSQPDGRFVGQPGKPTGVGYRRLGVARRAQRHPRRRSITARRRSTSWPSRAQYQFITGKAAGTLFIAQEPKPTLNGRVTGIADGLYTNLAVADAEVEIYEVDAKTGERKTTQPAHRKTTGADGQWGPFIGSSDAYYEFVLRMASQPVTHIYRSPFLRSSDVVHLRPEPFAKADEAAASVVIMTRPRGYFGVGRDKFSLDGKMPPCINDGAPGSRPAGWHSSQAAPWVGASRRDHPARTWPVKDNHIVVAGFRIDAHFSSSLAKPGRWRGNRDGGV